MAKILVVDDESPLREMLRDVLEMDGFEVVTADNGAHGLEKLRSEFPDLMLLDCSMPVMDGYETLEHMRQDTLLVNMPVIMLTVLSSEQDELKGLRFGVDDYITKPFKPSVLLARVKRVLLRKQLNISANPLTQLAGNAVIKAEAEKRMAVGIPFALVYIDLNHFKSYNDRYGFQRGDDVIKHTAGVLIRSVKANGSKGDFVGHIGGDDFIIMTTPEKTETICHAVIQEFDATVPAFYDREDREAGYIISLDRANTPHRFPLLTISLASVSTMTQPVKCYAELAEMAAGLKKVAKEANKSAWVGNTQAVSE